MMRLFRQYIIGGDTGGREGAWFMTMLGMLWGFAASVAEFLGNPMPQTFALLTVVLPVIIAKLFLTLLGKRAEQAGWIEDKNAGSG